MKSHSCLAAPIAVSALASIVLWAVGVAGWPGETGAAGLIYCEASRAGFVAQPANTWSNLAYVAVGILIGWRAKRDLESVSVSSNRMTASPLHASLYASVVAFIGPCSMALHASTTRWGSTVDVFAMYVWASFALAYAVQRLLGTTTLRFVVLWLGLSATLTLHLLTGVPALPDNFGFGIVVAAYACIEGYIVLTSEPTRCDRRWLAVGAITFVVAFAIWYASHTGGPLCAPHSPIQGHAVWHVLTAASAGALYLFYRSEDS
jgi:hypothetical protein